MNTPNFIRKKRKYSIRKKEIKKNGRGCRNPSDDIEESKFPIPKTGNRSLNKDDDDKEYYCTLNCLHNRKYNGDNDMIRCDGKIFYFFNLFLRLCKLVSYKMHWNVK